MSPTLWALGLTIAVVIVARPRPPVRLPAHERVARSDEPRQPDEQPHRRPRRRAAPTAEVARWAEALARAVRGGDTVAAAVSNTLAPDGHSELVDHVARNLTRSGGIGTVPTPTSPDVALVLAVLAACIEHGGPAAEPLDRAAGVLRARAADQADRQIHSAQARLSAQVLTILPAAMLVLLLASSSSVRAAIVTPFGLVLVTIGTALNLAGWRWMRGIIERAAR